MKITRLVLCDYQQFKHLDIDLTYPAGHPRAGEPLDKVCFIGRNGTGKSTILRFIKDWLLDHDIKHVNRWGVFYKTTYFNQGIQSIFFDGKFIFKDNNTRHTTPFSNLLVDDYTKNNIEELLLAHDNNLHNKFIQLYEYYNQTSAFTDRRYIISYLPAESKINNSLLNDFSAFATRNDGAKLFNTYSPYNEITNENIKDFWSTITYKVLEWGDKWDRYLQVPENKSKTLEVLENEFAAENPNFLRELAEVWESILKPSGLFLDYENALYPKQLGDSLRVFIKVIGKNENIPSHLLSTGIRNLLIRIGYLFSLYHELDIINGFILIDEPENSLYPDVVMKLAEVYTNPKTFPNTQFFFATHNPLFAAQFDPAERIILEFDDDYNVIVSNRKKAPEGDDPNDVLTDDFDLVTTLGPKGLEAKKKYRDLKEQSMRAQTPEEKERLADEIFKIGNQYNF